MVKKSEWPAKVLAVLKSGNRAAAVAQIKVAPTVRDLQQLRTAVAAGALPDKPSLLAVLDEQIAALSAPRLHRSP